MNDELTPPRRRFQFRLRTLMIVVALLAVPCAYVDWEAKIVRERRAELSRAVDRRIVGVSVEDQQHLPWLRRILGDKRIYSIKLIAGTDDAELNRVRELFPEARVETWTPAGDSVR